MTEISKFKVSFAPKGSIHELLVHDGKVVMFDKTFVRSAHAFNTADFFFLEEINPEYIITVRGKEKIFPSILDAIDWWLNADDLLVIEPQDDTFWNAVLNSLKYYDPNNHDSPNEFNN